jgi:hypothetical protein
MQVNGQKEVRNPIKTAVIHDKFTRFKAANADEYKEKLKKMSLYELSEEATRIGFSPGSERPRIEKTLLEEYSRCKQAFDIASGKYTKPEIKQKEQSKAVKDMLDFIRS